MWRFFFIVCLFCFTHSFLISKAQSSPSSSKLYDFKNVTATHLPKGLVGRCMDAAAHDFDGDGDVDVMLAMEYASNLLLINDGKGKFSLGADMPKTSRDSEDIAVADFDGDGDLDVVIVSEDDKVNEYYLNQGAGKFVDVSERLPLKGESNAVVTADINGDGAPDVIIGNVGFVGVLINDGKGGFIDESDKRMPRLSHRVQDLALADVDNDGDLDLLTADEYLNRILINNGKGIFTNETKARFKHKLDITREVLVADIDNDGDVDIFYANVDNRAKDAVNRVLINDSNGVFSDVSKTHWPLEIAQNNFTALFTDLNGDDAPDLIVPGSHINHTNNGAFRFYVNYVNGKDRGKFVPVKMKTPWPDGNGFDIAKADFNGDGKQDYYLCNRARRGFGPEQGGFDGLMFGLMDE